ncbi:MAG TPA: DUF2203 domain-containing protein [Nitrolancea sp.]|nr:DUF2203 domain-containing protein [Nitrolancea sp.]
MAEDQWETYFTVEEARALVPQLRELLETMRAEKEELDEKSEALQELAPAMNGNGHAVMSANLEHEMKRLIDAIQEKIEQITRLGVEVKDIDRGLVDFPSLRDGRVVYLCWLVSEPTVSYWHDIETGFIGRQPLDI